MACSSCNRNNRRSNNWGCRKAVQNTRWPSCGSNTCGGCSSCQNGCNTCGGCSSCQNGGNSCGGCSSCQNGCNTCGSCGSCQNGCNTCGSCGSCQNSCNTCTSCGSTTVCSGRNTAYAQPYGGSRSGWNRWRRDWDNGGSYSNWRNGCSDCNEDRCFPFYCGPCGPVNPVCGCNGGCSNGCSSCSSCQCREAAFGFFTQVGALDVNAGGMVPFNGGSAVEGIWEDGGELTLESAGVYLVTLSADIPSNVTLYTELDVRVNGVTNPGGRLVLDKDYTGTPLMNNTQTMITVNEGAVVTVTSSESIGLSADNDSDPIVTLSIVKVS